MRRALLAFFACVAAMLFATPAYAAGDYSIDELSTELTVERDASVHVVDRQTVTFSDHNLGLVWYLHVPEDGESVRISSVRVAPTDDGGTLLADWTRLQMMDSNPRLQGTKPGDRAAASQRVKGKQPWYSYSIRDGMVRCYFPTGAYEQGPGDNTDKTPPTALQADDYHTYVIETDFVIFHRVRVYRDVAELYWRYVNDSLPSDSDDVNLQVHLPVPEGWEGSVSEAVQAWGHGPSEGAFSVHDDGSVTYHLDRIAKGNYAEAHLIFPAGWLTDVLPQSANVFTNMRAAEAASEEAEWVDRSQREAAWDNNVRVLFLVLAVAIILVGMVGVLRNGRSPRSRLVLLRVAATLVIVALGENLFFREPLTTFMLAALAGVVALVALAMPLVNEAEGEQGVEGGSAEAARLEARTRTKEAGDSGTIAKPEAKADAEEAGDLAAEDGSDS